MNAIAEETNNKNHEEVHRTNNDDEGDDDDDVTKSVQFEDDSKKNRAAAATCLVDDSSSSSTRQRHQQQLLLSQQRSSTRHIDLATGRTTTRQQSVTRVTKAEAQQARSRLEKIRALFVRGRSKLPHEPDVQPPPAQDLSTIDEEDAEHDHHHKNKQFRIRSHDTQMTRQSIWESPSGGTAGTASWVSNYLAWTFQVNLFYVVLATFVHFTILILVFTALIYAAARYQPQCLYGLDERNNNNFVDAFQLSWTTLSTVGYGLVGPETPSAEQRCIGINILCAFESFVGVLFAGVTGAIIFSKVARVQSIAQVMFSYPICIRYGTGVMEPGEIDTGSDDDDDEDDNIDNNKKAESSPALPCPVLEFRIINRMSGEKGGEILNASVNVVASVLAHDDEIDASWGAKPVTPKQSIVGQAASLITTGAAKQLGAVGTMAAQQVGKATLTVGKATHKVGKASTVMAKTTGAALLGATKRASIATGSLIQQLNYQLSRTPKNSIHISATTEDEAEPYNEQELERKLEKAFEQRFVEKLEQERERLAGATILEAERTCVAVDEGNAKLAPPRIYHKLEIETDAHPFFKRVWNIRHVLDETSPLLSFKARRMIAKNDGCWPQSMNNSEAVREHVRFNDIIVSFSGTANVSGSTVYSQKVYDYDCVNVGYTFANVLAKEQGVLIVDAALLNDVREQDGGGAEPLDARPEERNAAIGAMMGVADEVTGRTRATAENITETTQAVVGGVTDATKVAAEGVVLTSKAAAAGMADIAAKTSETTKAAAAGMADIAAKTGVAFRTDSSGPKSKKTAESENDVL